MTDRESIAEALHAAYCRNRLERENVGTPRWRYLRADLREVFLDAADRLLTNESESARPADYRCAGGCGVKVAGPGHLCRPCVYRLERTDAELER